MKLYNKLYTGLAGMMLGASVFTACTDKIAFGNAFQQKPSGSTVTKDTVFNSPTYTEQFLTSIYALQYYGLPYNNKCGNSASPWTGKFDQLTDCWLMHWDSNTIWNEYYSGTLDATKTPLLSYTNDNVWQAVRAGWLLIENVDNVPGLSEEKKASFKAQAKCLIAARYFDLFAVYGGLPIVDHAFEGTESSYNLPRATVEETVNFMVGLLDDAINSNALLWAYDGNTTETDAANNTGRWTQAGAEALKAKILTFAASPLYNADQGYYGGTSEAEQNHLVWYGNFDQQRWKRALEACEKFFADVKSKGHYQLVTTDYLGLKNSNDTYRLAYRRGYIDHSSPEILHSVRVHGYDSYGSKSYVWHAWLDTPARLNCLPTEEYVELFPWSSGQPFNWDKDMASGKIQGSNGKLFYQYKSKMGVMIKTPQRDPRLYEECIVTGQNYSLDGTTGKANGDIYELWVGGYDAASNVATWDENSKELKMTEALSKRYASGYDCNKYYIGTDYQRTFWTQWSYLSLNEMYLMYAECLAQCDRLTEALAQVNVVRKRVGLGNTETYTPSLKTDKAGLIDEILNERARELGLSNNHYYDMIRYKKGEWMTKPLHGLLTFRMQKNAEGQWVRVYRPWKGDDKNANEAEPSRFEYEKFEISNRKHALWGQDPTSQTVTKWFLWPFPQTEINKGYGLIQNPGW